MALDPALPGETPAETDFPVRRRSLVAVEQGEVRATQLFFENEMYISGEAHPFVWPAGPVSESLVNPRYALGSVILLKHSLLEQPLHMALGLGSYQNTITRIFVALGWHHQKVPFFFFPVRANRVLRQMRTSPGHVGGLNLGRKRKIAQAILLWTGLGWLGCLLVCHLRRLWSFRARCLVHIEDRFGDWTDRIWTQHLGAYGALTRRDAATLNALYPPGDKRYHRLRVTRDDVCIGWILATVRDMEDDRYFGNLRVGGLADGLCHPDDVQDVLEAGFRYLLDHEVDICISNWSHRAWTAAARRLGFLNGPSNYLYFVSKAGVPPLLSEACPLEDMHLNRGDGDGPIRLVPDEPILES